MSVATQVKERGILFSAPMVRAILADEKTMTRRAVKFPASIQNPYFSGYEMRLEDGCLIVYSRDGGGAWNERARIRCPYGVVGDRLWVRETWGWSLVASMRPNAKYRQFIEYRASGHRTGHDVFPNLTPPFEVPAPKWRPSIHMPKWASRITLEITEVRVERLCEISEEDAIAEGCFDEKEHDGSSPSHIYMQLWDTINGKKYPWSQNPWCWVISFRRTPQEGHQ